MARLINSKEDEADANKSTAAQMVCLGTVSGNFMAYRLCSQRLVNRRLAVSQRVVGGGRIGALVSHNGSSVVVFPLNNLRADPVPSHAVCSTTSDNRSFHLGDLPDRRTEQFMMFSSSNEKFGKISQHQCDFLSQLSVSSALAAWSFRDAGAPGQQTFQSDRTSALRKASRDRSHQQLIVFPAAVVLAAPR